MLPEHTLVVRAGSFEIGLANCKQVVLVWEKNFSKMRNCLTYATHTLPAFLINLGLWSLLEVLESFGVKTDVLTLDEDLKSTSTDSYMKYGATRNEQGLWQNRTVDYLLEHIIKIICNPGSPSEAVKINTAIKTLTVKKHGQSADFYKILSEGLNRRMIFQKMSQIAGLLSDEVAINSELLIMLINRELLSLKHLQELSTFQDRNVKIAHYLIHNVNNYHRLKIFLFVIQNWACDTNLIELVEEISFEMEVVQSNRIQEKIEQDRMKTICSIY